MNLNRTTLFKDIPEVAKQRSRFDRSASHKTTFDTGDLIPIYVDEVLPGDTISLDFSHVTRMTTPVAPVMDNAALDVYAFFVPCRLLWNHWKAFWGENEVSHWEQSTEYEIPQIEAPSGGWDVGSLADYLGIPTGVGGISVNHLPFRAYTKIYNDWFRDENLKDPCNFNIDETTLTGINYAALTYDYVTDTQLGALPVKAAKFHDYFTSALPSLQKGPAVNVPLGSMAPIKGKEPTNLPSGYTFDTRFKDTEIEFIAYDTPGNLNLKMDVTPEISGLGKNTGTGLYADLSNAIGATITQLRQAFAIQRFYEAQARGGSRYIEFIKNIFGVTSPDARQQRSEFLGAKRFAINMDQVLQTSSTDATSPQGNTAAFSCTVGADNLCTYSATEHGYLMILECVRTEHSYQQGLEKMWNRKKWTDFYVPQFANLSEMPIRNKEIYATGTSSSDDGVFGYQEAWAEYRYKPNRISGKLRSTASGSLDIWHYGDEYASLPYLSGEWIDETKTNMQRTLAVQTEPQFVQDSYVKANWTRVMPLYSVPGLLDHH